MGTRNLVMAIIDGEVKIAQYGHSDGYPTGQGDTIVNFLRNTYMIAEKNKEAFRKNLRKCQFLTEEDIENINKEVSKGAMMPEHLSCNVGAEILNYVYNSPIPLSLVNQEEFAADSLFCEWAYVVDFDSEMLEVYNGFNQRSVPENNRFKYLEDKIRERSKYYPVTHVISFKFDDLTDDTMQEIENSSYDEEE